MEIHFIDEEAVRQLLPAEEALDLVEKEFSEHPAKPPILPTPRLLRMNLQERYKQVLLVKSCALPAEEVTGVRIFGSGDRFIVLMDIHTSQVKAWVDDRWLYQLRTAAEGVAALKKLAPPGPIVMGLIGAGVLARPFLQLVSSVESVSEVRITSRRPESRRALAKEMSGVLTVPIQLMDTVEDVVRGASVIATLTTANAPLVQAEWLDPGALIISMGNSQELAPEVFQRISKLIVDDWETCKALGDIAAAIRAGILNDKALYADMHAVFRGDKPGRENPDEVILVIPQGMITQDVLLAVHVYRKAVAEGIGKVWIG
jgi:ornithine cyclodeaminase